jgi:hypothetical protein
MVTAAEQRRRDTPTVERDPSETKLRRRYGERQVRKSQRAAQGKPRRLEDAETIDEALDIEYERGRTEGAAAVPAPALKSSAPAPASTSRPLRDRIPSVPVPTNPQTKPGSIGAPFLVEVVFITADEIATNHRAPLPSRLLATSAVFGMLGLLRGNAQRLGVAFAWSLVLATFYAGTGASGKGQSAPLSALQWLGDFMSGKIGNPSTAIPPGNLAGLPNNPKANAARSQGPGSAIAPGKKANY